MDALHIQLRRQIGECKRTNMNWILTIVSEMQDKFQYLESNKLCTFSALFWLEFSSQHGDDLCGLLDSYAALRRGMVGANLDFLSKRLTTPERSALHPIAANHLRQMP